MGAARRRRVCLPNPYGGSEMTPYYQDDQVTLYHGDAFDFATRLEDGSADCIVTSPPYFGLRDYGTEGQYGLEASPVEYVETMRALFAELRRVLADDGTLWLNLGDSYAGAGGPMKSDGSSRSESPSVQNPASSSLSAQVGQNPSYPSPNSEYESPQCLHETMPSSVGPLADMRQGARNGNRRSRPRGYEGIPAKSLLGIPWRVAFALQDDGWILRNAIIWHKPNAMPESVTDRLSTRYEHVFMFSKSRRYWFDLDPIRDEIKYGPGKGGESGVYSIGSGRNDHGTHGSGGFVTLNPAGRNPGDVWTIPTQPFPGAHFAVYPVALPQRCILAGCKPGGTVLDPFNGSGTTGLAAQRTGRKYIGIDLNSEYLDLSLRTRLSDSALNFEEPA
ncbi:site-specific DNA-methyltransferase [Mycobacterium phage Henu3 PeY-2017]|nr:site-specific DNA-methyltransferase [Mycobacterium phage Henu3 PeY-2017]